MARPIQGIPPLTQEQWDWLQERMRENEERLKTPEGRAAYEAQIARERELASHVVHGACGQPFCYGQCGKDRGSS